MVTETTDEATKKPLDSRVKGLADIALQSSWQPNIQTSYTIAPSAPLSMEEPARKTDFADHEGTITRSDVDALVDTIKARFLTLLPAKLEEIRIHLLASVGTTKNNLSELATVAMNEARLVADETSMQQLSESPQQTISHLWADISGLRKEVRGAMSHACKAGYISDEEEKKSKEEEVALEKRMAQIDAMPEGEDKQAAIKSFGEQFLTHMKHDKACITKAVAIAKGDGNTAIVEELQKAEEAVEQEENLMKKYIHRRGQRASPTSPASPSANAQQNAEQEPPSAEAKENKMAVKHDVTLNDVQSPFGGKDRNGSRAITKTT